MKKKINKKDEDFKIKSLKSNIEGEKKAYNWYVKTLVKFAFTEFGVFNSYAHFGELNNNLMMNLFKRIQEANISKDKKLNFEMEFMFGEKSGFGPKTEKERLQEELEYVKRLNNKAKYKLNNLSSDIKRKKIEEEIEEFDKWDGWFNHSLKVYKKIEELEKKKKPVKKAKTSARTIKR